MNDFEVSEVRRIRREICAEHGNDIDALVDYYQELEGELRREGKFQFSDQRADRDKAHHEAG